MHLGQIRPRGGPLCGGGGIHIFLLIIYLALNFYVDCRPKRVIIDVDFDSFHGDIVDLTRNML